MKSGPFAISERGWLAKGLDKFFVDGIFISINSKYELDAL
jgi:hypothetical protein